MSDRARHRPDQSSKSRSGKAAEAFVQQARDFLNFYFDGNLDGVWMTAFYVDPGKAGDPEWKGMPARQLLDELPALIDAHDGIPPNLYWSPFRYRNARRGEDNFIEAVAIPIDDVGPQADVDAANLRYKLDMEDYRRRLSLWKATPTAQRRPKPKAPRRVGVKVGAEGLLAKLGEPTTRLPTSEGNEQWFFKLDPPCSDKAQVRAVLKAIDSDAKDLARVMRAPGGANWKASALSPIDGEPFLVELGEHDSSRKYKIANLLAAVGAEVRPEAEHQRATDGEAKLEFLALEEAGLLLGGAETGNDDTKGSHWIICPGHLGDEAEGGWIGAETGHSLDDEGKARVWRHGGFKCHHASCGGRTFDDLCGWTSKHPDAGPILERLSVERAKTMFSPISGDEVDDASCAMTMIRIYPGDLETQTRLAAHVLKTRCPVYYYGEQTVQMHNLVKRQGLGGGKARTAVIGKMTDASVTLRLLESVTKWKRYDVRSDEWVRCNAPKRVADNINNSIDLRFEEISGIIHAPFLRADGTIGGLVDGYDRKTGLWVDHGNMAYRPVFDAECTRANALAALERIRKPLSEYRFTGVGEAVALSAMLTPVMRPAVRLVPMFVIDAPIQGSGKTILATAICSMMTGLTPALVQGTNDPRELDKRINGALLTGEQCVVIDNIIGRGWGTPDLCAAITAERVKVRPLGTSKLVPVINTFIIFGTGNNVDIEGDVVRRTLVARIDPDVERPERNVFPFDPIDYVREHRVDLVHDLLLILRAYALAGRPAMGGHEIGSFGEWSRIVRDALMWLGQPDVAKSIDLSRASNSPELDALLPAWETAFGVGAQAGRRVGDLLGSALSTDEKLRAFGECLREHTISTSTARVVNEAGFVGKWLSQRRDQRAGGLKLQNRILKGASLWFVSRDGAS